MNLDVVIPCLNGCATTWRCIQHVLMFGAFQRIILVDDGSTDSTPHLGAWLERQGKGRYIRHPRNLGVQCAWNTGWRAGTNPLVCFMNNDVAVMPGCTVALADAVKPDTIVSATQMLGQWDPGLILSHAHGMEQLRSEVKDGGFFGGCFVVPRANLIELGGFDERFFLTYGDTDFIERARDNGVQCVSVRGAFAFHGGSVTRRRELGIDGDIERDLADRTRFEDKWEKRPDVLERYPRTPAAEMKAAREKFWGMSESIE